MLLIAAPAGAEILCAGKHGVGRFVGVQIHGGHRGAVRRAGRRGLKPRITHILKDAVPVERLVTPVDVGPGIEELLALLRQRKNAHAQGILVAVRHLEHIHVA